MQFRWIYSGNHEHRKICAVGRRGFGADRSHRKLCAWGDVFGCLLLVFSLFVRQVHTLSSFLVSSDSTRKAKDNVNQHHDRRIRSLIENAGGILIFLPRYRWYQHILSRAGLSLLVLTTAWSRHNPFDHAVCVCVCARDVHIHTYIHFSLYTYIYIFIYIYLHAYTHIHTYIHFSLSLFV